MLIQSVEIAPDFNALAAVINISVIDFDHELSIPEMLTESTTLNNERSKIYSRKGECS